jgi:hypothetical protein
MDGGENRMEIFDLLNLSAEGYENRNVNVCKHI